MVRAHEVIEGVRRGIENSGRLPSGTSYLTREPDPEGTDASVTLPAVVLNSITVSRDEQRSTDLVGYHENDQGQRIGRIFDMSFTQEIQVDLYVAAGSSYDTADLATRLDLALGRYDSQLRNDLLPDGNGGGMGSVTEIIMGDRRPADDLTQTPSLRRQRKTVYTNFIERVDEVEEYGPLPTISEVITPSPEDYVGDLGDYELEYQPPP